MKTLLEYIVQQSNFTKLLEQLGSIKFDLDNTSLSYISESFKQKINEGYVLTFDNIISEMSQNANRYNTNTNTNSKQHGNRIIWKSNDGDTLKIGDHATQREDRPIDKGGDGEHINEEEIINMFIYAWNDIMDMYYEGALKYSENVKSFVILCKCYLKGSQQNLHPDGARPEDKHLWAAWLIDENYKTGKIDITIKTIFRGEHFKHGKVQERIVIANNGYIKQKYNK